MLHEAIFLATCNATMTNKKPFKLQRGCYTQLQATVSLNVAKSRGSFYFSCNSERNNCSCKMGCYLNFFLQLATQRLLRCKLQEKLLRIAWPLFLIFSAYLCIYFYNDYIVFIFTFVGIFSLYTTEWNLPCINKVIYLSIYLSINSFSAI